MKKIAIQGICFDDKSSFLKGAAQAPPLIRQYLHSGVSNYYAENGLSVKSPFVIDQGNFTPKDYFDIEKITLSALQKDHKVVTLGGDHSITYPIIKAYSQHYPSFAILQIDAHPDLYDEFNGDPYSHACPFARILESRHAERLVQIGIRTLNPIQAKQAQHFGVIMHEMKNLDISKIELPKLPLYLSIDLDGLDPAYAPGVSHHEPGGLSTRQVIQLIHQIKTPIIGADIVEYNPINDINNMTAALAAKLLKEIISKMITID